MSSHRRSRPLLLAQLLAIMVVPVVLLFAAIPWLKQQPEELVFFLAGIASTLAVVACLFFAILHDRQLDEWHRSNARFSTQWGWAAGISVVALLLTLPPVRDSIVHWAAIWSDTPNPDDRLVVITFTFGFVAVAVAQTVCMALLSIGWTFWKSRSAREPS